MGNIASTNNYHVVNNLAMGTGATAAAVTFNTTMIVLITIGALVLVILCGVIIYYFWRKRRRSLRRKKRERKIFERVLMQRAHLPPAHARAFAESIYAGNIRRSTTDEDGYEVVY